MCLLFLIISFSPRASNVFALLGNLLLSLFCSLCTSFALSTSPCRLVCLFVCLSVCLPALLSVCLFVCLYVHLSLSYHSCKFHHRLSPIMQLAYLKSLCGRCTMVTSSSTKQRLSNVWQHATGWVLCTFQFLNCLCVQYLKSKNQTDSSAHYYDGDWPWD